ncbi:S9 family peptidase [bacterium]|nr:S9 family peptidase [bacterium]
MKSSKKVLLIAICIFSCVSIFSGSTPAFDQTGKTANEDKINLQIEEWLVLGPASTPFPAFNEEKKDEANGTFLLSYNFISTKQLKPEDEKKIIFPVRQELSWTILKADDAGITLSNGSHEPETAYLASYLELPRWAKLQFKAKGTYPFKLMIDGKEIIECNKNGTEDYQEGTAELKMGKHTIIVKTVCAPKDTISSWKFNAFIEMDKTLGCTPLLSLSPTRNIAISDILNPPHIDNIKLSPDGSLAALTIRSIISPDGDKETRLEIRKTENGKPVKTIICREGVRAFEWTPDGKSLSYTVSEDKKTSIRKIEMETGNDEMIAEGIERFENYKWSPDGEFIIYSASEEPVKNKDGVKRLRGIYDKTNFGRHRSFLYLLSVKNGATRKITTGKYSSQLVDIHPNGESILVTRLYEDISKRPYEKTELVRVNLREASSDVLWEGQWFNNAMWSPDGKKILVSAGASSFGNIGINVSENTIPNDYDGQIYIFDPESKDVNAITRGFNPSVRRAYWSKSEKSIYLVAEDKSFVRLFKYSFRHQNFKELQTGCDVISSGDFAIENPVAVFAGMSADHHQKLYLIDLGKNRAKEIYDPAEEQYEHIRRTNVKEWNFTASTGKEITGRVHYPPDFDPETIYPCIVYYYGGTSPVSRSFGGRYPKNLWASMGYIVYVLQPSGATGFGQEFSAAHVNDWGKTVAGEIIEGTKEFLKAHSFVDPERVGCIGASFGGFMTELLVTKTDIFAAAISHAGISSISSYWGGGYWGYSYNAVSAANSFPWNSPDIYINQSPLFSADKVNTPLLLLHGESDTNVPTHESDQMYTALKLLGKEVEYIRFAGQNHFILDYKKRIKWSDATLAWFDKWLKEEPQWWNNMYPPIDGQKENSAKHNREPAKLGVKIVKDEDRGTFLVGEITMEDIQNNIPEWDLGYYEYKPDMAVISELVEALNDINITCILGTWCSDCQRTVPRLWKVLKSAGYPLSDLKMLAVASSRAKETGNITEEMLEWSNSVREYYNIKAISTIIVKNKNKEIGRIIETVQESVEKDLLQILNKK